MDKRERNVIRKRLLALEVERERHLTLIDEIREILDKDEQKQKNAKSHNKRSKKNGRFIKDV